jgi:2-polyprenyl-6-methoxyphenol hydroxylase-like FAD-dependent oxidoreductase
MAPFKVIIVGGSIAGMALANMLERYGIDFIVLEKHSVVAPQLGASIATLPNGQRILQQLGCLDAIIKQGGPSDTMFNYDGETKNWIKLEEMGNLMEKLFVDAFFSVCFFFFFFFFFDS